MHTAADIRRMLADGETVQAIAQRTGWKTTSVQAIADKPAVSPPDPDLEPARALLALIARTLKALSGYDGQAAVREAARARESLERLEEALTVGEKRRAAADEVARLRRELAEAEAALKELGGKARTGPSAKEIRAWAAASDIDCPRTGLIPTAVRSLYDAAHPNA